VYVLQAGLVLNAFGNGAANPFLVIYLHDVRGVPLGVAGLAAATSAFSGLVAALVAGSLADRRGARATMIGGLLLSALGFALYPLIRESWQAIAIAIVAGSGIGTWLTMQSALLAAIVPPDLRHLAFAQQRVAANVGLGLGGFVGGIIVSTGAAASFTTLFLLNSATFLVYVLFLLALRAARARRPRAIQAGSYRELMHDRLFVRFLALNFLFVASTISLVNALFPVFAKNQGGIGEEAIGVLFLLNSLLIIGAQIPVARALEGHRRMRAFALMGVLFALCWTLVLAGGAASTASVALVLFAVGIMSLSLGECIYDSVQGPLTAALAPASLTGRYMAANGFSWQLGFIVGPGLGGPILAVEPFALWPIASALSLAGAVYARRLDRLIPAGHRSTPTRSSAQRPVGMVETAE
jgi:MFS family permease